MLPARETFYRIAVLEKDQLGMETEPIMSTRTFEGILHPFHKKPPESQLFQAQSTWLVDVNQDLFRLHQIAVDSVKLLVLKVRAILKEGKQPHILTMESSQIMFPPQPPTHLPSNYPSITKTVSYF